MRCGKAPWILRRIRYSIAWWKWFFNDPIDITRPMWRKIDRTQEIILQRHQDKEPKRFDYDLE